MTNTILFPYHPVTGLRLEQTVDYIPASAPRDIFKENGELVIGEADGQKVCWDGAESQVSGGESFLSDNNGNECLVCEAVWVPEAQDSIKIEVSGKATGIVTPNGLRDLLLELASAAREVVLDSETGANTDESCKAVKRLLMEHGLWEDFQPDEA